MCRLPAIGLTKVVTQRRNDAKKPPSACKQPKPGTKAGPETPKVNVEALKVAPAPVLPLH